MKRYFEEKMNKKNNLFKKRINILNDEEPQIKLKEDLQETDSELFEHHIVKKIKKSKNIKNSIFEEEIILSKKDKSQILRKDIIDNYNQNLALSKIKYSEEKKFYFY